MKISMRGRLAVCLCICAALGLTGCGWSGGRTRIVRVSHGQSETHPEHIGLLAFKAHVEQALGEKYEIQIFPNEILGASQKAIELTQTGAIDFVVAGTANLETFAKIYEIFSMPYLFKSEAAYYKAMGEADNMKELYASTDEAGFRVLTWYSAGTRNFYAKRPIQRPEDLKGMKNQSSAVCRHASIWCRHLAAAARPHELRRGVYRHSAGGY